MSIRYRYLPRILSLVLTLVVTLVTFTSGCTSMGDTFKASDDTLTILVGNSDAFDRYLNAIQTKFPDVDLDIEYYLGANTSEYIRYKMLNGETPDLVFSSQVLDSTEQEDYLLDLSGYDFVSNFNVEYLNKLSVDGKIYLLPIPYTIGSLLYNKTLFAEYGWEVPTTHEEFVSLLKQIRQESDLIPISITGRYNGTYFRLLSSLSQCDYLSTLDGKLWEKEFAQGTVSAEEGFGGGVQLLQDWLDANAFDVSDVNNLDGDTYNRLLNRECAIAFPLSNQSVLADSLDQTTDEFGAIPFYGLTDSSAVVTNISNGGIGLSKSLGESKNASKLATALEIMEYFSTEEGQNQLVLGSADIIPLNNVSPAETFPPYEDVWELVQNGRIENSLYIGYEDIVNYVGDSIKDAMFYGGSLDNLLSEVDSIRQATLSDSSQNDVATVSRDFSHEETITHTLQFLLEEGGGDIAVVSDSGKIGNIKNRTGVSGKLFKGELTTINYNMALPGANAGEIVNVTMLGSELVDILQNGLVIESDDGTSASFDYYALGVTYDVLGDSTLTNLMLSDGSPLAMDRQYRITMVSNDFVEKDSYNVDSTGVSVNDAYLDYLSKHPTI